MGRPKHEDNSQVFDVSKPGRSAPSHTSRPLIMDHRQIADDPMVSGGNDETELMTHSKTVVPIAVSSDSVEYRHEVKKEDTPSQADDFFGNKDDAPAGEQTYVPPEHVEAAQVAHENSSGFQSTSDAPAEHTQPHNNPPPDSHALVEQAPLPAGLTAPEIDDPVGLSNVDSSTAPLPGTMSLDEQKHPGQNADGGPHDDNKQADIDAQNVTDQLPAVPENIGEIETLPFPAHHGAFVGEPKSRKWFIPVFILILLGTFLVFDTGIVGSGKLPFELIKNDEEVVAEQSPIPQPQAAQTQTPETETPKTQSGLTQYSVVNTPLSFAYPTAWGNAVVAADPGFLKRGGTNKTSGIYAYLVGFETNKDVQIALTSNKSLPASRAALYYDYLQWCTGTHDSKIYRQKLLFSTAAGVDSPSTITCSDGPLPDSAKSDELTIIQKNTKDAAGKPAGDIYTKNLSDAEFVVLRVKDSAMTSGESIKTLLASVKMASQPASSN